jgi:hypothetical protein
MKQVITEYKKHKAKNKLQSDRRPEVRLIAAQRQAETMRGSALQLSHNALVGNVHICRGVTRVRCTGMHTRARALS